MLALKILATLAAFSGVVFLWWPSAVQSSVAEATQPRCAPSRDLLGLDRDAIRAKCGEPNSVNHQMISGGAIDKEQWSFRKPTFYVYLTNGKADSIQYAEAGQNFEWKL
jgi:hypothetical protein